MSTKKESFLDRFLVITGKILITPFQIFLSLLGIIVVAGKIILTFLGALLAVLILVVALLINQVFHVDITPNIPEDTIVEVNLAGPASEMPEDQPWQKLFKQTSHSLPELLQLLTTIEKDTSVKGVILRLDQFALTPAQVEELRGAVQKLKKKGKKILAYADTLEGMGNKGTLAYYLACACDEIWIHPIGQLEMQGFILEVPFAKEGLEKLGVKPLLKKRLEYKNAPNSLMETKFTAPHREATQALLDSFMKTISKGIQDGRDLTEKQVKAYMDGAPWTDQEAKRLGLVDRIAFNDELITYFVEKSEDLPKILSGDEYLKRTTFSGSTHQLKDKIKSAKQMMNLDDESLDPVTFAILYADGTIVNDIKGDPSYRDRSQIGAHAFTKALRQARNNEDVQAIIIRINTPGGRTIGSEIIRREIQNTVSSGKKVILSMGSVCASGGYWLASAASKIVAQPSTITGSIGVYGGKLNTIGFWEKLGIFWDEVHYGENAILHSQTQELTEKGDKNLDRSMDYIYAQFIQRVVTSRKLDEAHVREISKGRVWSGVDAHKFGLVDQLGGLEKAIEVALKELDLDTKTPVEVLIFPEPLSFIQRLNQLWSLDLQAAVTGITEIATMLTKVWTLVKISGVTDLPASQTHLRVRSVPSVH